MTTIATTRNRMTGTFDPAETGPAPVRVDPEAIERTCPNCDARMDAQSCKLKCPRCGYFKSCSDF